MLMKLRFRPFNTQPILYRPLIRVAVAVGGVLLPLWALLGVIGNSDESYVITNAAVAVLLAAAGICFSFSGAISDEAVTDRIVFAGERLFHGSLLIALSTGLRYMMFIVYPEPFSGSTTVAVLMWIPMFLIIWVFVMGCLFAGTGIRVIIDILNDRMFRYRDWDDVA